MIGFSAVVHTYNRSSLLAQTLAAIRRQSLPAAEIIVVDDGSTDDTAKVVKREFPEAIYHRITNSGAGAARKAAADLATKEWIMFCDDDDLWLPEHLQDRAELIERFPSAEFTFSNFKAFGPMADTNYVHLNQAPPGWWDTAGETIDGDLVLMHRPAFRQVLAFDPAYPTTWGIRRDVYRRLGGIDPRFSRLQAEDSAFLRHCTLATTMAGDRRVTALYRRHGKNKSQNKVGNFLGSAEILSQQLNSGIIPAEYRDDAMRFIINRRKPAYLTAFWDKDFPLMRELFGKYPEVRRDWNLIVRYLVAKAYSSRVIRRATTLGGARHFRERT